MTLAILLHLVLSLRMVGLYLHSAIRRHGMVRNYSNTGKILSSTLQLFVALCVCVCERERETVR
jgi:hypothetical protein